jgi:hypothetical protein
MDSVRVAGAVSTPQIDPVEIAQAALQANASVNYVDHPIDIVARIEAVRLIDAGNRQLARGNIGVARQNFERAADQGLAVAAARLADTFDARSLARMGLRSVKPNRSEVRKWRDRALELSAEIATWSDEP